MAAAKAAKGPADKRKRGANEVETPAKRTKHEFKAAPSKHAKPTEKLSK